MKFILDHWLSENICLLILTSAIDQLDPLCLCMLSDVVVMNLNVHGSCKKHYFFLVLYTTDYQKREAWPELVLGLDH